MIRFLGGGIWPVSLLLGLCVLTFFLSHIAPGDPARIILGPSAHEDAVAALRAEMGLDKPVAMQFGKFLGETLTGHWGDSWLTRQPVLREIGDHLRPTLFLGLFASIYSVVGALLLNALALACPRLGAALIPLLRLGIAVPSFVIAVAVAVASAGIQSRIMGAFALSEDSPWVFVLPAWAVALYPLCVMTALLRDRMGDILASPYFRAAQASGGTLRDLFWQVLLANSWSTLLTAWVNQISLLVFSTIVVEYVFSFRGIGSLLISSIQGKDLPVTSGIILVNGFFFLLIRSLSRRLSHPGILQKSLWRVRPEEVRSL